MSQFQGRLHVYTDYPEVNDSNVIKVLQQALPAFTANLSRCDYLISYEGGNQPLKREKTYRPEINIECIDNLAAEITAFKLGYQWTPISFCQAGESDDENRDDETISKGVVELNEQYTLAGVNRTTEVLGRFVEITGIGYTFVDLNMEREDEDQAYFSLEALDPRNAFVVRSTAWTDKRVVLGVMFSVDTKGIRHYTCFTKERRYEINQGFQVAGTDELSVDMNIWQPGLRSGEVNPLGIIPIIEWERDSDRQGVFERQLAELDNLNILASDFSNSVDQNVQCIWHGNDVEFPVEEVTSEDGTVTETVQKPTDNDWILTSTTMDGKTPFITPLTVQYDYNGMIENYTNRRMLILQKCGVPNRMSSTSGATGVASSDAAGWSECEILAARQQLFTEDSKMKEWDVVKRALHKHPDVPQDAAMLKLHRGDIRPNIRRQKTYEMTVKSNALATYLSHGVYGLDALKAINAFDDVNEVWQNSKDLIKKYQASIFEPKTAESGSSKKNEAVGGVGEKAPNADRSYGDLSDQRVNSPSIDKGRG